MATTTNFGWETPDDTDLVKDGAAAMRTLGNSIDTSFVDLKGGTTGQVLAKASATDLDYTWTTPQVGDITAVTAGTGISGGGTGGDVTITNSMATAIDAKGDLVAGTGADAFSRLAVGTNGQVLTADSAEATGLKWASAAGGLTLVKTQTIGTAVSSVQVTSAFSSTYENYLIVVSGGTASVNGAFHMKLGSTTTGYYMFEVYGGYGSASVAGYAQANGVQWYDAGYATADSINGCIRLFQPQVAKKTSFSLETSQTLTTGSVVWNQGYLNNTTQYTDFTIFPNSGTFTGGTIRVYGFQNS